MLLSSCMQRQPEEIYENWDKNNGAYSRTFGGRNKAV
jgi:hypothetical protein